MSDPNLLTLALSSPPLGHDAGLFLSRGKGIHPDRTREVYELIFVRQGRLAIAEDGRDLDPGAGETIILWPGRRHYGTKPYASDLQFYWLHFTLAPATIGKSAKIAGETIATPQQARPNRPQRLAELFHRYLDDQQSGRLQPASASLLLMLMLWEVGVQTEVHATATPASVALAGRAETFIATHFHQPIGTAEVARALDCNPDYLGRTYHSVYGRPIVDAINRRRIDDARRLLLEEASSLAAVARECGFADERYFRRVFKRLAGLTPGAYRKLHARAYINSR